MECLTGGSKDYPPSLADKRNPLSGGRRGKDTLSQFTVYQKEAVAGITDHLHLLKHIPYRCLLLYLLRDKPLEKGVGGKVVLLQRGLNDAVYPFSNTLLRASRSR